MMACLLHCCTCSNAFVCAGIILICYGCLFYHLLIWCLQIDSDDELSPSNNAMPKCYVQVGHLDVPEETIDEAMELCMGVLPSVLDPYESPAFHAKRELAARHLADTYIRDHPTLPPDPVDSELPWCDLAAAQRAVGAGN